MNICFQPIELQHIEFVNEGSTRAHCSVRVGDVVLHYIRVVQRDPRQSPRVYMPSYRDEDETGSVVYKPVIILDATLLKQVRAVVLDGYHRGAVL